MDKYRLFHFGFEDMINVLFVPAPGHCLRLTFFLLNPGHTEILILIWASKHEG